MNNSNFWYYVIFTVVILHVVAGFIYIAIKLSPKKKNEPKDNLDNKES